MLVLSHIFSPDEYTNQYDKCCCFVRLPAGLNHVARTRLLAGNTYCTFQYRVMALQVEEGVRPHQVEEGVRLHLVEEVVK
jgi:hypothetical protein